MKTMKGQLSTEFLIIVALILLLFIPLLVLVYFKASETNAQIAAYQAELTVNRLTALANSVGSLGKSKITTEVFVPPNTVELKFVNAGKGAEVVMVLESEGGLTTPVIGSVEYAVAGGEAVIATRENAGGWIRVTLSTSEEEGKRMLVITRG